MLQQYGFLRLIRAQPVTMGHTVLPPAVGPVICVGKVRLPVKTLAEPLISNSLADTFGISREARRETRPLLVPRSLGVPRPEGRGLRPATWSGAAVYDKLYDAVPMSSSSCPFRRSCPPGLGAQAGELQAQAAELA
jgi:hypothetical protein